MVRISAVIAAVSVVFFVRSIRAGADEPKTEIVDYTAFSRLLHKLVTANLPKETEQRANWNQSIPIPDKLILKNAQRTYIKVGDHMELAHGSWKRMKAWIDDPAKDVILRVRDLKKKDASTFHLSLEAESAVHGEGELQQWTKGLKLLNVVVQADARFTMAMEIDAGVKLKTDVFPPELSITPTIVECKVVLKDFAVNRVNNVVFDSDSAKNIGNELKQYLQQLITIVEPGLKARINEGVAEGLKNGKGPSLLDLLK